MQKIKQRYGAFPRGNINAPRPPKLEANKCPERNVEPVDICQKNKGVFFCRPRTEMSAGITR